MNIKLVSIYITSCLLAVLYSNDTNAQKSNTSSLSIVKMYCDSIISLHNNIYSDSTEHWSIDYNLYKLITPSIYYNEPVSNYLSIDSTKYEHTSSNKMAANKLLLHMYQHTPELLKTHENALAEEKIIEKDVSNKKEDKALEKVLDDKTKVKDVDDMLVNDVQIVVTRPNFWKRTCTFSSQFTQNYFSENWHKGGNNNATMLTSLTVNANYNDQKSISWENTLDLRLGFITTTDDTCHNFLTNNDRIRLWSKLGVKANKHWAYTTTLEANTQFMPSHRSNDRRTYSDFLAPLDVIFSVGMDYKPKFKNGNTLSVALLPLSYKLRYVGDKDETIHSATNMKGKNTKEDFGSKVEIQSTVKILKNLTWYSRFVAFTSYEYVESEFENKIRFKLTKYISSELNALWRFDDNRPIQYKDDKLGYFQFREYFTLGLTYDF